MIEQTNIKDLIPAKDEKDCGVQGGAWIFDGKGATERGVKTCHFIHPDQGKPCLDGDECSSKLCFSNDAGTGGACGRFAKTSFCTFKKIMIKGKSTDEKDCLIE